MADLDGDGDLDVVLSNLRHETETTFWAGPTLWINQGGGRFTPHRVDFGGPSTAAGDVDGDGDADIVQMDYTARLYLNQGGA
ncbi:MAG: FG-GAP-like repeat-containing protein, partial [Acidobacteriota bacterium]